MQSSRAHRSLLSPGPQVLGSSCHLSHNIYHATTCYKQLNLIHRSRTQNYIQAIASKATVLAAASKLKASHQGSHPSSSGPTLLWYKHDLRIDDHPGLHQALENGSNIIPIFCFDPAKYAGIAQTPSGAKALHRAVEALRQALRALGSDLLITTGPWDQVLPDLVRSLGVSSIITEGEYETAWKQGIESVRATLPGGVAVSTWSAPLFDQYSDDFKELKKLNPMVHPPLPSPASLPPLSSTIITPTLLGDLPPVDTLLTLTLQHHSSTLDPALATTATAAWVNGPSSSSSTSAPWGESLASYSDEEGGSDNERAAARMINAVKDGGNEVMPWQGDGTTNGTTNRNGSTSRSESGGISLNFGGALGNGQTAVSWDDELSSELATGEGPVLGALRSYLRYVETSADAGGTDWQWKLGSAIAKFDVPATPQGCFPAIFGRALGLGVVSRRRIYAEAQNTLAHRQDWDPAPGILQQLAWLLTSSGAASVRQKKQRKAAAASLAAEAGDFHAAMAAHREGLAVHGATLHHWRWRGILTDYLAAEPEAGKALPGAPAIMLVHGFGAFGEHWRDNVAALASAGFTVYAPTFPGYGRAEKPVVPYGQDLWRDFLADFVDHVARKPVVVAGNSIGGFISASLAADYPGRVQGLILVNSAGLIQPGYSLPTTLPPPPSPPLFVVEGVSRALFAFLEGGVEKQLRRVYPVRPERADAWLADEISRSARDPGALGVFRSVFYLRKPRALNWLVTTAFGGPTMVLQGAKDPLNDAVGRAKELGKACPGLVVEMLDAGHCPHDEVPEIVNEKIVEFVKNKVMRGDAASNSKKSPQTGAMVNK